MSESLSGVMTAPERDMYHPRIKLPAPDEMTAEQRLVYDEVVSGMRGQMVGPLRAAIISPEMARHWSRLGEFLRYRSVVPLRQSELAIIVTARRWTSEVEWGIHARTAAEQGIPGAAIEAIRNGQQPQFDDACDWTAYEFARQLQQGGGVELSTYRAAQEMWGDAGVVELTAINGYYVLVAMTLNVHQIPLPEGLVPALARPSAGRLAELRPALPLRGR